MTFALSFKARVDSLACFLACAILLRFTSDETPVDLLTASIPYMRQQRWDARVPPGDLPFRTQTLYPLDPSRPASISTLEPVIFSITQHTPFGGISFGFFFGFFFAFFEDVDTEHLSFPSMEEKFNQFSEFRESEKLLNWGLI